MNKIAYDFFNKKKISISQQTINLIVERCKGNRENLKNELEKIENFCKNKNSIDLDSILKLTNLAENYNASELADSCLSKNIKKTSNILNENNYSNDDCILIIRTLLSKAKRIHRLREELNKQNNIEEVIRNFKPPIFWKDKEILKQQVNYWSKDKINNMITDISETELLIKKNSYNSVNILSDFILNQASN